ncbi:MAG: hypothetical protein P1V33_03650 [Pseudohongiella nitratireducens]|nr:hypothetical protein [Pseudohongiella nitratireducens]MDF1622548.1 hypothetical protein [Pseudohongiella nitratireducens]
MSDILITEMNSKSTGGDFFELYNFGSTEIDLSDWRRRLSTLWHLTSAIRTW